MSNQPKELIHVVEDWINENGGREVLLDLIISENHEYYQAEAVRASLRLKQRGILTYKDIKPKRKIKDWKYILQAITIMHPNYSYAEISTALNRSIEYIRVTINRLVREGRLKRITLIMTAWEENEINFILEHGHKMNAQDISDILGRTKYAVQTRKNLLGILMDEKYKKPAGRYSHKHNQI